MLSEVKTSRCLHLLVQLNIEHGWGLTLQAQQRYAEQIAKLCSDLSSPSDSELCRIVSYYHTDHHVVEALRDSTHPDHTTYWVEWTRQTLRWLIARSAVSLVIDEGAIDLDDLAQEAMYDLWRGLGSYRYRSRFQTWAFTVISHCLIRSRHTSQIQKRGVFPQAQSLDALIEAGHTLYDRTAPAPDEVALSHTLDTLLQQILTQHPDQRLTTIFQLWACEEQTLRTIGEQLNLSATRVHGLLREALTLLRSELTSQDWVLIGSSKSGASQIGESMSLCNTGSAR